MNNVQKSSLLGQIERNIESILTTDIETLVNKENLGSEMNFEVCSKDFSTIQIAVLRVQQVSLDEMPQVVLTELDKALTAVAQTLHAIQTFKLSISDAATNRKRLIDKIAKDRDALILAVPKVLSLDAVLSGDDNEKASNVVNEYIEKLKLENDRSDNLRKQKTEELEQIVENFKSFATQAGVSKHSAIFKQESEIHQGEAKKWFKYSVGILVAVALSAIVFAFISFQFEKTHEIVQLSITKLILLTVLFYALSITNRNYRAHKHNEIMNKHRQNALSTFETFSNATGPDLQTKNAVLLETTHAIFSNQQTGYLKSEGETDGGNKIVEIIKNVSSDKSPL